MGRGGCARCLMRGLVGTFVFSGGFVMVCGVVVEGVGAFSVVAAFISLHFGRGETLAESRGVVVVSQVVVCWW